MATTSRPVTVGTAPTRLDSTTDNDDSNRGSSFAVHNSSGVIVYLGGSAVTVETGWPLAAGSPGLALDLHLGDEVYAVVETGTAEVRVLETGV